MHLISLQIAEKFLEYCLEGLIAIIGLYLAFGKSYFTEKGKNLATSKDIEEITSKVEAIKIEFIKETEQLKANLNLITNFQSGLLSEEKNAIIEVNERYFSWLNMLTHTTLNVDTYENEELEKFSRHLRTLYNAYLNSEAKFLLFVDNDTLIEAESDLKIKTLQQVERIIPSLIQSLKFNNDQLFSAKNDPKKIAIFEDKRIELIEEADNKIVNNYGEILKLSSEFQQLCRDHIYDLITNSKAK